MFVRTASERDIPAIRALLVETWHDTYDGIYGAERVTGITDDWHSIAALTRRLTQPRSEYLVADDGSEIGGMAFAAVDESGETVTLHQLYVRPAWQGRGIGGLLLEEMIESFPDARRMRLEVEPENGRAVAFYEAQGFSRCGITQNCGGAGSGIPALIFERELSAGA
jgi:ribosomal protein S18 acetylase RimI-like enzyme